MNIFSVLTLIAFLLVSACTTVIDPPDGMVYVPPGDFLMGTDDDDIESVSDEFGLPVVLYEDEQPQHNKFLEGYYIDKYEVTVGLYKKFLLATGHRAPMDWESIDGKDVFFDYPVTFVNYYDANDYCSWAGKSLPTEAQWEKAAKGTGLNKYPWGRKFNVDKANLYLAANSAHGPMPIGSFTQGVSPYGTYDMVGNVWEWTSSWYDKYPESSDERIEYGRNYRVTRGQSYQGIGHFAEEDGLRLLEILSRVTARFYDFPTAVMPDLGFRCVKSTSKGK